MIHTEKTLALTETLDPGVIINVIMRVTYNMYLRNMSHSLNIPRIDVVAKQRSTFSKTRTKSII